MNNDLKMDNLKDIREKRGITQIKLSVDIEVSQELISQYERGTTLPSPINLVRLADYFNCSVDYLLGRTNNYRPIESLTKQDIEKDNLYEKFSSLDNNQKEQLWNFMDFLSNSKK